MRARTRPELYPRCELPENRMVRQCSRLYPGRHPCDVVEYLRVGERMTLAQVARHLGVGTRTVSDWSPTACRNVQNYSDEERQRLRERMIAYNAGRRRYAR